MLNNNRFLLLLEVQTKDGVLVPLQYTVGSELDFDQATTVDGRYTICLASLTASTLEQAAWEAQRAFSWYHPILVKARPSAWLAGQLGMSAPVERVELTANYDGAPGPLAIVPGIPETSRGGAVTEMFEKIKAESQLKPVHSPDPWGHYDFSKTSLAVVASDGHGNGCVLHHVGGHIAFDLCEVGRGLGDIGLDNAPEGISIWEGKHEGSGEDITLEGDFRDPTDAEAAAIAAGECPWDESEWFLPDKPCEHPPTIRVLQQGDGGAHGRIEWCPRCGALRLYGGFEWELPDREATR
jgi:hypothetical protein